MEKRAIIYTRVSDPSQIENNSLETQEKQCRDFANAKGIEVVRVFREEGRSAKTTDRPELRKALAFSCKKSNKITHLIVYKFNRFSRNTEEGLAVISLLAKNGVEVISATEISEMNPIGRAMRTVFMAFGQMENEMKGEVVRDNMQSAFRKGLWVFKCPVGYRRKYRTKEENKGIPPIQDENLAPIITDMFRNAASGIYNKTQLAKMMNLQGFAEHYRVEANHKIVDGILTKSFYYGYMFADKWNEYAWGLHEPLTDEQTWQKAYNLLILKKKHYQYQDTEQYPLKGAIRCEYCNHPMTTSPSRGNSGVVPYYECRFKGCKKLRINAVEAHKQFEALLEKIKPTGRTIKLFQHMVLSDWDEAIKQSQKQIDGMDDRIQALKKELKSIRKAVDSGLYTEEQGKEEASTIQQDIAVLEVERSEIKIEHFNSEIVREFTDRFLRNLPLLWENLDLPKRQALLQKIFKGSVIVSSDKKIRTSELSPSFQLIEAIASSDGKFVSHTGLEPFSPITTVF